MAATCALSALPLIGNLVAGGLKVGLKGSKVALKAGKVIKQTTRLISHSSQMTMSAIDSYYAAVDYRQARANGESGTAEGAQFVLSVAGTAMSAGGAVSSARRLADTLFEGQSVKKAVDQVTRGVSSAATETAFATNKGKKVAGGTGALGEDTFDRYMPDGRRVTDVSNLPGSEGVKISRRLSADEMTFLTQEYGVEFAQVYHRGAGKNGGGGYYMLYSGNHNSVSISRSIGSDAILINHTHPRGTMQPSPQDISLLQYLQSIGSPQKVSEIIPIGKGTTVFFNVNGVKR